MSLTLGTHHSTKPTFRLTLKRFVVADGRVVYASDIQEALHLVESGL